MSMIGEIINLNTPLGTTNHSLLIGNAIGGISSLGVATNGQIPIGSVGANPVLATLTAGTGITITNGPGTITVAATVTTLYNYTNVNASPYVVAANDEYLSVDCSGGAITVQLPNAPAPATGRTYIIKDRTGNAAAHNITISCGALTIDGAATYVINTNFEAVNVLYNGTNYEIY